MKRPTHNGEPHGQIVTTPSASMLIQLLGSGYKQGSIAFTCDEIARVRKLYDFVPEPPNEKPAPPPPPQIADFKSRWDFEVARKKWEANVKALDAWIDPRAMLQSGADRNTMRYAEADGLRLLAWIAKYTSPGEDPLKILVRLASDAGYDVDASDRAWAVDEGDDGDDGDDEEVST
jgi:hypothetical protein